MHYCSLLKNGPKKVLSHRLPEYNSIIKAGFLLAPAVFMTHATDPLFQISQFADDIDDLVSML
jgi:hypothetical protein